MKKTIKYLSMAALALVGAVMTSCTNEDIFDNEVQQGKKVTLTTTISLDGGAMTRSLESTGHKTFAEGEQLAFIYKGDNDKTQLAYSDALTASDISADGKSATITISAVAPAENSQMRLVYPAAMAKTTIDEGATINDDDATIDYDKLTTQQDGTLATLSSNFDLAVFDGLLNGNDLPASIPLANQLAICELSLKNEDGTVGINNVINHLIVSDGANTYTISRTPSFESIFLAMKPVANTTLTLTASDSYNCYTKTTTSRSYVKNNMYLLGLRMTKSFDGLATPLTFEAKTAGALVTFTKGTSVTWDDNSVEYSTDGSAWDTYTSGTEITLANVGDKVSFRGTNSRYAISFDNEFYSRFFCSNDCYIYGNVMSLIDKDNFATNKSLTEAYALCGLFDNNPNIYNHPTKSLTLPATTLTSNCYASMFSNCTHLTTAPVLPAMTLATGCYNNMFNGCTSMTTAPALPAEALADNCYEQMFKGCTSLTTAPELPATTLADCCYLEMFNGCTSLNEAPVLPAKTLVTKCYAGMFMGCISLTSVTCLATDITADNCTSDWLSGVPNSGTFTLASGMYGVWTEDASGIPTGWGAALYEAPSCTAASIHDIGKVIGEDGRIYANAIEATAAYTKAAAMIAYVGKADGVCDHGLAISLTDAYEYNATFAEATGNIIIPSWATVHPVTGGTWRLPSFKDWQYLLWGYYVDSPATSDISGFNTMLTTAGGTALASGSGKYFWTGTSVDEDNAKLLYYDGTQWSSFSNSAKVGTWRVRACLAF